MSYFPENVWVELLTIVDGLPTWTNIGGSIVSSIRYTKGFSDGNPLSRLAPGGDMRFDLNNSSGAWDPSATFYKGQKIRLRVKYGSLVKTKWFGYIDLITLDVGTWGPQLAHVTAIDWLGLAAKTPVRAIPGLANTTIDIAVATLLTQMQIRPEATDFEIGNVVLPYVFDQITPNSTIYSELQNLVMGEWGYIYLRDGGETLKIENSLSRTGDGSDYKTTSYYNPDGVAENFLLEDGTNFLLEDGTNFLLEGEPTSGSFNSDFDETYQDDPNGITIRHGDNLTNKIMASAIPTIVGGSTLTLYPFDIANGAKAFLVPTNNAQNPYILQGQYKDPTAGGSQISGANIVVDPITHAPIVSTDWRFNSKADGSGSDLSANITITFTAGASGFKAVIVNTGAPGYFTRFNVRGVPVYRHNPVETVIQDQRSIWDYGDYTLQFTRQYGATSDDIQPYIFRVLMRDRKPRTIAGNPKFQAFDTLDHLSGYLILDIGDQIRLASTKPATDALYYIQGERATIQPGSEQITMDYVTAETLAGAIAGVEEIAIEGTTTGQLVNFGYIPSISNHVQKSLVARIYIETTPANSFRVFINLTNSTAGWFLQFTSTRQLEYIHGFSVGTGTWRQTTPTITEDNWFDIAITHDASSPSNNAILYINGSVVSTTFTGSPSGATGDEAGALAQIGGASTSSLTTFLGKLENIGLYNRILTPAEITAIHNGGTRLPFASYPVTGLKFFFGGMDDEEYAAKLDTALGSLDTIYELVNGFTGQPIGSPTLRAVG
jgi:hypothetical protein